MFDWKAGPESNVMSRHIWIYWAVTIPLTLLVLLIWVIWMKRQYLSRKLKDISFLALRRTRVKGTTLEGIHLSQLPSSVQNGDSAQHIPITLDLDINPALPRVPSGAYRWGRESPDRVFGM